MAQASITSYFNTRKRAAADALNGSKHKLMRLDFDSPISDINEHVSQIKTTPSLTSTRKIFSPKLEVDNSKSHKRIQLISESKPTQQKNDSPAKKKVQSANVAFLESDMKLSNADRGLQTPTKEEQQAKLAIEKKNEIRKKLSLDEIKLKLTKSDKISQLKTSLNKLKELEQTRQSIQLKSASTRSISVDQAQTSNVQNKALKQFQSIELEVLTSPKKECVTLTKEPTEQTAEVLMSPKKTIPTQVFSPSKSIQAYKAFQNLVETSTGTSLQLPYKYRCLTEIFKCLDTVCAMFYNRKEIITMKKLKPAVQRMLRRNFSETHLAQIKYFYPDAYHFSQRKMLNAGSHTKYDYYQLVITPYIENDIRTVKSEDKYMTPQILIKRQYTFVNILLNAVRKEHDTFLKALDPPMNIPKDKITRWHPDFELQNCPDINRAALPEPPNVEKFSSAKDVLSTARNLFNSASPSSRMPETIGKKIEIKTTDTTDDTKISNPIDSVLKGIPKSLLDKIREKQAARAMENMTRRPSQDQILQDYNKLPEVARHLRNIFVTENKSVLELEFVLDRIENSYREKMSRKDMKDLLQLISKELSNKWLIFHHIRKTDYLKIDKTTNLCEIVEQLQSKAQAKLSS